MEGVLPSISYIGMCSLRSKRFRGVSALISMFWPRENWGESKKRNSVFAIIYVGASRKREVKDVRQRRCILYLLIV